MYTWRTDESGLIRVCEDGGAEFTPVLQGAHVAVLEKGLTMYGELFEHWAGVMRVPAAFLAAMAKRESQFRSRAFRQELDADGKPRVERGRLLTGVGLFQITNPGLKGGLTDEQLFDPGANTAIAARHISHLMLRAECQLGGRADFPRVAAAFNAGSVRVPRHGFENSWGFHCSRGHIDEEVAALNSTLLRGQGDSARELANAVVHQFDLRELAAEVDEAARGDRDDDASVA